jgi:hypothetical protein
MFLYNRSLKYTVASKDTIKRLDEYGKETKKLKQDLLKANNQIKQLEMEINIKKLNIKDNYHFTAKNDIVKSQ